ncbi:MAG: HupE/UreJ family protein [Calditrichaeota bacterium]|nr:HupE/UreJ family protein [Calditrichota bacterium]HQU73834.1 HupE/UreJ family protein [Calditrichia bacterium]
MAILAAAILLGNLSLSAHSLGQSYVFLNITEQNISGRFEITLPDLNRVVQQDYPDLVITPENLAEHRDLIEAYYQGKVSFAAEGRNLPFSFTGTTFLETDIANYAGFNFDLENPGEKIPDLLTIDYRVFFELDSQHQGLLVIETFWRANLFNNERVVSLSFSPEDPVQELDLAHFSIFRGIGGVIKLGIKHILIGIDHILFLIALILPSVMIRRRDEWEPVSAFRPALLYVVKIVTLFTIAHSVTLSLAALGIVELNSRFVESVIALSIAIAALDILFPIFHGRIGVVVFVFGLFHGFGFASVLGHLGVLGEHLALSLFSFNLGVEIGQIAVICLVFPLLFLLRKLVIYRPVLMNAGSVVLILIAMMWFVERAFAM